jgi:transposase
MKRLNVGIDVSKDTLDVAYWEHSQNESVYQGKFPNTQQGFHDIMQKVEHICQETNHTTVNHTTVNHTTVNHTTVNHTTVFAVMEPTGGYEQSFARFAIHNQWQVSLPNPYRVKMWAVAMGIRAKTDKHDAKALAHYGFMQDPHQWKPLPPEVEELKYLLDRLTDQQESLQRERNRLEKYQKQDNVPKAALKDLKQSIAFLERHILQIQEAIMGHLKAYPHLKEQRKLLLTVPGVGQKNVLHILVMMHRWLALTDGEGDMKESMKSLVAYVGLDPKPHESGTSVRKRAGISRQGNRPFRSRLFMTALGGIKGKNSPLTTFYKRLVGRDKPKKVALVAAARKILIWCWAVFRSNIPFDATRYNTAHLQVTQ